MRTQTGTANDMHIIIAHMFMFIIMLTTVFLICLIPFEYIYIAYRITMFINLFSNLVKELYKFMTSYPAKTGITMTIRENRRIDKPLFLWIISNMIFRHEAGYGHRSVVKTNIRNVDKESTRLFRRKGAVCFYFIKREGIRIK